MDLNSSASTAPYHTTTLLATNTAGFTLSASPYNNFSSITYFDITATPYLNHTGSAYLSVTATPFLVVTGAPNVNLTTASQSLDSIGTVIPTFTSVFGNHSAGNSSNGTFKPIPPFLPPQEGVTTGDIVAAVFYAILIALIVIGNSLVIGSFKINRRLRTTTNYFIMSLAIADMSIGTISIPLWVYFSMLPSLRLTKMIEYKFWLTFDIIVGVSSILNLTLISMERCYALLRPIQHRNIRKRVVVALILLAWCLAILAGCLQFIMKGRVMQKRYPVILATAFFLVPVIIIFGTYAVIFRIATKHARGRGVRSFRKDLRIATTVAVVIGLFTFAWAPFFALNFFYSICGDLDPTFKLCGSVPDVFRAIIKWMQYGNSACNPIVYGFRNRDFRLAFKRIIYSICGKDIPLNQQYLHSRSTYANTARFVRTQSSFDESQSVLYPDQIVPPGMYDMRDSYKKAITKGSKAADPKAPAKGIAHGLLSINMDALSMNGSAPSAAASTERTRGLTNGALDVSKADDNEIDIYPLDDRNNGVVNESFDIGNGNENDSQFHEIEIYPLGSADTSGTGNESFECDVRRSSRVRFGEDDDGDGNTNDDKGTTPNSKELATRQDERERSHSDVTHSSQSSPKDGVKERGSSFI